MWRHHQPEVLIATKAEDARNGSPDPPEGARPCWIRGSSPVREEIGAVLRHLVCGDSLQQPREPRAVANCHSLAPRTGGRQGCPCPSCWLPFLPAAQANTPGSFQSLLSVSHCPPSGNRPASTRKVQPQNPSVPVTPASTGRMTAGPSHWSLALRPVLLVTDVFSFAPLQPPRCPSDTPGPLHRPFQVLAHSSRTAGRLHVFPPSDVCSKVTFSVRSVLAHSESQRLPQRSRRLWPRSAFPSP